VAATRHVCVPLAIARSGVRETVFMIAGIGVHDQLERPFRITGIRTLRQVPRTGGP
jgi:hypothetical protein